MSIPKIDTNKVKKEYYAAKDKVCSAFTEWLRNTPGGSIAVAEASGLCVNMLYKIRVGIKAASPKTIDKLKKVEGFPEELESLMRVLHKAATRYRQLRLIESNNALIYMMYAKGVSSVRELSKKAGIPENVLYHICKYGITERSNAEKTAAIAKALGTTRSTLIKLQERLDQREHELLFGRH